MKVRKGTFLEAPLIRHLTDRFCATAKAEKQVDFFDDQVSGLALRVSPTAKSWTVHYTRPDGKRARLTIGRYPLLSLASARTKAQEAKAAIAEGRGPAVRANTLRAVVDEYFAREGVKLRSVDARRSVFDRLVLPILGDRPINDVRRSEIIRLLDDIEDNNGPGAARVASAYLGKVFNWHASRDDDFRSPIVRGMAKPKSKARDRILNDDEIRAVWHADAGLFGRYLKFLLLTAVRRNEAACMTPAEVVGSVWTIPASRMKAGVEHVVPLSAAALAVLPQGGFNGVGHSRLKREFDAAVPLPHWTLHDLRRTARSLLSRAGVSPDVAERCLAHAIGGVRGVYDRHAYLEEKRAAFDALAKLVAEIVGAKPRGSMFSGATIGSASAKRPGRLKSGSASPLVDRR
jgi:integrase